MSENPLRSLLFSLLLALAAALLLMPGSLRAATVKRTVLVLSVAEEGRQLDGLRGEVGELIERAGATLVDASSLPANARRCEEPTCLEQLGHQRDVELILAARIQRHSRYDRLVEMWTYNTHSGRDQSMREFCDARALRDCLTGLAGKLVGPQLAGTQPQEPAKRLDEPAPAQVIAQQAPRPRGRARLPTWRKALGWGLVTVAMGGLITGIGATAQNNTRKEGCLEEPCTYHMLPLLAPSFAIAGIAAIGATLSFALPSQPYPSTEVSR